MLRSYKTILAELFFLYNSNVNLLKIIIQSDEDCPLPKPITVLINHEEIIVMKAFKVTNAIKKQLATMMQGLFPANGM